MTKIAYKSVIQNVIETFLIIAFFAVIIYFCFYVPLFHLNSNKEITGIVKDKWIDISETQQGSGFRLKALVESETNGKFIIECDRKTHDQIKIGMFIKREANGEIKILE